MKIYFVLMMIISGHTPQPMDHKAQFNSHEKCLEIRDELQSYDTGQRRWTVTYACVAKIK